MANGIGITTGVQSWTFQNKHIERHMDNAAYQAAHPDNTLVLAGPARLSSVSGTGSATDGVSSLLAIGMLQAIQFTQTKPTQPLMAIGSGRSFFVSGKSQTQWTIGRLFANGRNLLRVLYHNFVAQGAGDASAFDDPAALAQKSNFFMNLDSELFYCPFGLGTIIRTKSHDLVASWYTELSMINSWAVAINSGGNMILENVTGLADRMLPFYISDAASSGGVARSTLDAVLDFVNPTEPYDASGGPATIDDSVDASTGL